MECLLRFELRRRKHRARERTAGGVATIIYHAQQIVHTPHADAPVRQDGMNAIVFHRKPPQGTPASYRTSGRAWRMMLPAIGAAWE